MFEATPTFDTRTLRVLVLYLVVYFRYLLATANCSLLKIIVMN